MILVYGLRDWSFQNIESCLKNFEYERSMIQDEKKCPQLIKKILHGNYNLVITCEPHSPIWTKIWKSIKDLRNRPKVLAPQQGMYYSKKASKGSWHFDTYLVWGEQMKEATIRNGLSGDRIIVTGCPKHDKMWNCETENGGYQLVLLDGVKNRFKPKGYENKIVIPHPNKTGHKIVYDTYNLCRRADLVAFQFTGCGLWPLIMGKPCHVYQNGNALEVKYQGLKGKNFGDYIEILPHENKDWIKWAVTDNKATERITQIIKENL